MTSDAGTHRSQVHAITSSFQIESFRQMLKLDGSSGIPSTARERELLLARLSHSKRFACHH
jgi:hypothetical protein